MTSTNVDGFGLPLDACVSYQQLRAAGVSRHAIDEALHSGALVRARRDVYLSADAPAEVVRAQRVGGRLDCLSVLQQQGVFVLHNSRTHVQIAPHHSRLRSPHSRREALRDHGSGVLVHWREVDAPRDAHTVPLTEALAQSASCQPPRAFVASLDSALNQGLIGADDLASVFGSVPGRYRVLMPLVDARAEAGSETIARLLLRGTGRTVELQRWIDGVGRVDLLVDGWIVVECDSRSFHAGWAAQETDRARDLALAARGFVCIRPTAALIFTNPEALLAAVRGLLALRA